MGRYAIGVDFGTLSGRAVLAEIGTGRVLAAAVHTYEHAVMGSALPCGTKLGADWALQHPQDYLNVLDDAVPAILRESGVKPDEVVCLGIDVTASTVLPVRADGTPLCSLPAFQNNPHAYVKLWKHHAAQPWANRLNEIARERGEAWLDHYGGKVSSEWTIPKLWQVLDEAPDVYDAMDAWMEAADWIVWQITGQKTRSTCCAGYKALWNDETGYPPSAFFRALDTRLEDCAVQKLSGRLIAPGERAGYVCPAMARRLGLSRRVAVCAGNVDAHVCVPAAGIAAPGEMLAIMGTSTCHMVMSEYKASVPGICGVVRGGILPGYYGYEAGQPCVGDCFAWFVEKLCPAAYTDEARVRGMDVQQLLTEKAAALRPGQSGLLALDWWNGSRSLLNDADLSGLIVGMRLSTTPEDIYRALIEATAYGTRAIIENFRAHGVAVDRLALSGGIARKNAMAAQIFADVTNMELRFADSPYGSALGSAIFAAVAAGREMGGYDDVLEAARAMGGQRKDTCRPIPENVAIYEKLYNEYTALHDVFGRGVNDVMKRLRALHSKQKGGIHPTC